MEQIKSVMQVNIQCVDNQGETGTFLADENGVQFGDTYKSAYDLFNGHEVKFCKAHGIKVCTYGKSNQLR